MSTEPRCTGVIPGTFIVCGEGGNYCSEECEKEAGHMSAHDENCPMRGHANAPCECRTKNAS